jgi:hypothetical protein
MTSFRACCLFLMGQSVFSSAPVRFIDRLGIALRRKPLFQAAEF